MRQMLRTCSEPLILSMATDCLVNRNVAINGLPDKQTQTYCFLFYSLYQIKQSKYSTIICNFYFKHKMRDLFRVEMFANK